MLYPRITKPNQADKVSTTSLLYTISHSAISCIFRVLPLPGSCLASGDENGLIKTWDWRAKSSVSEFQGHTDFISDLTLHEAEQCLVAVSGDGTLSLNDLKTQKVGNSRHSHFNGQQAGKECIWCAFSGRFPLAPSIRCREFMNGSIGACSLGFYF